MRRPVYLADQTEPVKRKVALKVLKPGMDTREVVARFEAERQALALMDHTNIAQVFDGGATESGRPYFVMELVKGFPLTKYCDDRQLTTRQRLDLFLDVTPPSSTRIKKASSTATSSPPTSSSAPTTESRKARAGK